MDAKAMQAPKQKKISTPFIFYQLPVGNLRELRSFVLFWDVASLLVLSHQRGNAHRTIYPQVSAEMILPGWADPNQAFHPR